MIPIPTVIAYPQRILQITGPLFVHSFIPSSAWITSSYHNLAISISAKILNTQNKTYELKQTMKTTSFTHFISFIFVAIVEGGEFIADAEENVVEVAEPGSSAKPGFCRIFTTEPLCQDADQGGCVSNTTHNGDGMTCAQVDCETLTRKKACVYADTAGCVWTGAKCKRPRVRGGLGSGGVCVTSRLGKQTYCRAKPVSE